MAVTNMTTVAITADQLPPMVPQKLFAEYLGISIRQFQLRCAAGEIPPPDFSGRPPMWKRSKVLKFN